MQALPITGVEGKPLTAIFDCLDPHILLLADANTWHVLRYTPAHVDGPSLQAVSTSEAQPGCMPMVLNSGALVYQMPSGHIAHMQLDCFAHTSSNGPAQNRAAQLECAPATARCRLWRAGHGACSA